MPSMDTPQRNTPAGNIIAHSDRRSVNISTQNMPPARKASSVPEMGSKVRSPFSPDTPQYNIDKRASMSNSAVENLPNRSAGASVSRLEEARRRAMNGVVTTATAEPAPSSPGFQAPYEPPSGSPSNGNNTASSADLAQRLSRLEVMTRQVGQGSQSAAAISSVNSRRNYSVASKASSRASDLPPPPPQSGDVSVSSSAIPEEPAWKSLAQRRGDDSDVDIVVFMDSMAQGIVGQAPSRSTDEEKRLMVVSDEALRNRDVGSLLGDSVECLHSVFRLFFDVQEEGIPLNPGKWGRGVYKLLESFDILPSYCSKKDIKTIFALVIYCEMPASSARGFMNFHTFVKFLVTLSIFCLSNPPFASLYQTPQVSG